MKKFFILFLFPLSLFAQSSSFTMKVKKPIEKTPGVFAYLDGRKGEFSMTKSTILGAKKLTTSLLGEGKMDIVSFDLTIAVKQDLKTAPSDQDKFSLGQVGLIYEAQPGRKIYIEHIKAKMPDGKFKSLPNLIIKIIEEPLKVIDNSAKPVDNQ